MFRPVDIFPAHLKDFIAIPIVGCSQQDLASFGDASQSVFGVVIVDGGFSFCLFFDQVSVIIIDVLYFVSGLRVFLGNDLIVLIVCYCYCPLVAAFGDGHSASCCVVGIHRCAEGSVCVFGVTAKLSCFIVGEGGDGFGSFLLGGFFGDAVFFIVFVGVGRDFFAFAGVFQLYQVIVGIVSVGTFGTVGSLTA